jgi:hypothetical protein
MGFVELETPKSSVTLDNSNELEKNARLQRFDICRDRDRLNVRDRV